MVCLVKKSSLVKIASLVSRLAQQPVDEIVGALRLQLLRQFAFSF